MGIAIFLYQYNFEYNRKARSEILAEGIGLRAKGKIILQSTLFSSFFALRSLPLAFSHLTERR